MCSGHLLPIHIFGCPRNRVDPPTFIDYSGQMKRSTDGTRIQKHRTPSSESEHSNSFRQSVEIGLSVRDAASTPPPLTSANLKKGTQISIQYSKTKKSPFTSILPRSISILLTILIVWELALAPWTSFTTIYRPTILANAVLLIVFGRTLHLTKEPIIAYFCRIERGTHPLDMIRYTRTITWIWTFFFAKMALAFLILSFHRTTIFIYILYYSIYYFLIIILLFGEYGYRLFRFRKYSHLSPIAFFIKLAKSGTIKAFLYPKNRFSP